MGETTTQTTSQWSKFKEWARRYLPCEIAGTSAEFGAAALAYVTTDSLAVAAVAATIGASIGYYAAAYVSALRWTYRDQAHRRGAQRWAVANLLALRSVAVEFGPAELIDSIAVRPLAFYVGPLMFGNVLGGWIFGKLVSDVAFYACAIFSYERFTSLLARRQPDASIGEEDGHEPTVAVSAA
ncbi:hypothetical protein [Mycobacterium sp. 236(2023)]|uniref:hypothetical protein n=1 Tax=Mycobacterium sp. 236(2023) TaxID=3038163 RepID=UPI002414E74F|nr:hypothetical protein [Mycobacterium sp. 236(2023)]MDG4665832.1 hypothetical protein [Mycobacterium sp. 236(2023)]